MNVILTRTVQGPSGTFGQFALSDGTIFVSLELPWNDNKPSISCVPPGTYQCQWLISDEHPNGKYHVVNVPGRDAIEIHSGNWGGDVNQVNPATGQPYKSDVLGCCILGKTKGILDGQDAILSSTQAISEFEAKMAKLPFSLEIKYL